MYALVVAKGGPKLKLAAPDSPQGDDDAPKNGGPDRVGSNGFPIPPPGNQLMEGSSASGWRRSGYARAINETTAELAGEIGPGTLGAPLTDATGLAGRYDYTIFWSTRATDAVRRGTPATDEPDGPSIFDAVQDQLGLKIEKRRGPVQMLVVDHVERKPTEN